MHGLLFQKNEIITLMQTIILQASADSQAASSHQVCTTATAELDVCAASKAAEVLHDVRQNRQQMEMKYALMEVEGSCCEDVELSADHGGEVLPHPTSSSTDRDQAIDPKQR